MLVGHKMLPGMYKYVDYTRQIPDCSIRVS